LLSVVVAVEGMSLVKQHAAAAPVSLHSILRINSLTADQLQNAADPALTSHRSFSAEVTTIRPDGRLVIEAMKEYRQNGDKTIRSYLLTGVIRPADVKPNWTVLGQDISDLKIETHEHDLSSKWPSLKFDPGSLYRQIACQLGVAD
jgi:flagellar basal body L-ring protein FlgH